MYLFYLAHVDIIGQETLHKWLFCNWQQTLVFSNRTELANEHLAPGCRSFPLALIRQKPSIPLQHPVC